MILHLMALTNVHLPQLIALERAAFSDPWSAEMLAEELVAPSRRYIGIFFEEKLVAYAGLFYCLTEGEILTVAADPEMRRQGLGTHLLQELLRIAQELALLELFLEVRRSNLGAIGLYERFGFAQIGVRKGYYRSPTEDALLYKLAL